MKVKDIMTADPITVTPLHTVRDALGLMLEYNVRHLPVQEEGILVGMLSDRDIRQCAIPLEEEAEIQSTHLRLDIKVSEIMTRRFYTLSQDDSIKRAIELIIEERISGVPVVADSQNTIVGILSYIDILEEALSLFPE